MPLVRPAAVVGLDAVGDDDRVAPALGENLLLPAGSAAAAEGIAAAAEPARRLPHGRELLLLVRSEDRLELGVHVLLQILQLLLLLGRQL